MENSNNSKENRSMTKPVRNVVVSMLLLFAAFCRMQARSHEMKQPAQIKMNVGMHILSESSAGLTDSLVAGLTGDDGKSEEEKKAAAEKAAAQEKRRNEVKSDYFIFGSVNKDKCEIEPCVAYKEGDSFTLTAGSESGKYYYWAMYVDDGTPTEMWCSADKLTEDMLTPTSAAVNANGKKIKCKHYTFD